MKKPVLYVFLTIFNVSLFAQDYKNMSNRQWWNELSPAWKTIIQEQELKGKNIDPNDEQLDRIVKITHISCSENKDITNLKPLAKLQNLEVIHCNNTSITSLDGVQQLTDLKELDCSNNDNINSLQPIEGLVGLEVLNAGNTMVTNLAPLRNLKNLKVLDLHFCAINDLNIISSLSRLTVLDVSENESLYDLHGVENLTSLAELNVSMTRIKSLKEIQNLQYLEKLYCSDNQSLVSLKPLEQARFKKNLKELDCSNTGISSASLESVKTLYVLEFFRCKEAKICEDEINDFLSSNYVTVQNKNLIVRMSTTKDNSFISNECF